ncbi:hypothetical protein ABIB34_002661, partial [Rhodococcus sp. UYP5]
GSFRRLYSRPTGSFRRLYSRPTGSFRRLYSRPTGSFRRLYSRINTTDAAAVAAATEPTAGQAPIFFASGCEAPKPTR